AGAAKVDATPSATSPAEGSSFDVVLRLDAPIIALTPDPTVRIDFTVADPTRLALSTTSVEWAAAEWTETRTITVDVLADGLHAASNDVTVQGTPPPESDYYDGFVTSFSVSIADVDPAPPPPSTDPPSTDPPTTTPTAVAPTVPIAVAAAAIPAADATDASA